MKSQHLLLQIETEKEMKDAKKQATIELDFVTPKKQDVPATKTEAAPSHPPPVNNKSPQSKPASVIAKPKLKKLSTHTIH